MLFDNNSSSHFAHYDIHNNYKETTVILLFASLFCNLLWLSRLLIFIVNLLSFPPYVSTMVLHLLIA